MSNLITVYHSQTDKSKNTKFGSQQFIRFRIYPSLLYQQIIESGNEIRKKFQERLIELIIKLVSFIFDKLLGLYSLKQILNPEAIANLANERRYISNLSR